MFLFPFLFFFAFEALCRRGFSLSLLVYIFSFVDSWSCSIDAVGFPLELCFCQDAA